MSRTFEVIAVHANGATSICDKAAEFMLKRLAGTQYVLQTRQYWKELPIAFQPWFERVLKQAVERAEAEGVDDARKTLEAIDYEVHFRERSGLEATWLTCSLKGIEEQPPSKPEGVEVKVSAVQPTSTLPSDDSLAAAVYASIAGLVISVSSYQQAAIDSALQPHLKAVAKDIVQRAHAGDAELSELLKGRDEHFIKNFIFRVTPTGEAAAKTEVGSQYFNVLFTGNFSSEQAAGDEDSAMALSAKVDQILKVVTTLASAKVVLHVDDNAPKSVVADTAGCAQVLPIDFSPYELNVFNSEEQLGVHLSLDFFGGNFQHTIISAEKIWKHIYEQYRMGEFSTDLPISLPNGKGLKFTSWQQMRDTIAVLAMRGYYVVLEIGLFNISDKNWKKIRGKLEEFIPIKFELDTIKFDMEDFCDQERGSSKEAIELERKRWGFLAAELPKEMRMK